MKQEEVSKLCKEIDELEIEMEKTQTKLNDIRASICAMKDS